MSEDDTCAAEQGLQQVLNTIVDELDIKRDDRASKLLQQSRTQSGRQLLVDHSATALLPPAFKRISQICTSDMQQPQYWDTLIWMLQFTRNLCATGDAACISLLQAGVLDTAFDLTDNYHSLQKGNSQMHKLLLQLLVNMAASSPFCSQHIWAQCFPDRLAAFAEASQEETAGPLCTLLLLITKNSDTSAHRLCTQSPSVLTPLLQHISSASEPTAAAVTLGLLIHHVIFQQGLLQAAMTGLPLQKGKAHSNRIQQPLCGQQVVLLQLLAAELEEPAGSSSMAAPNKLSDSVQFLVYWVHTMSVRLKPQESLRLTTQKTHQGLAIQNLEAGLQVLRALTALQDSSPQPVKLADDQLMGMLVCSLAMLAALNPIQPPRRRTDPPQPMAAQSHKEQDMLSSQLHNSHENMTSESSAMHDNAPAQMAAEPPSHPSQEGQHNQDAGYPAQQAMVQQNADSPEELMQLAVQYPKQSPYSGYRCDLVALLANLCFRRPAVQHKVQQLGGVDLILSQCQWDNENPLVREYGLWAVRNLCEGNESIQESISSLRACSTVDSPDLQQIGMQLQLDGTTGKPKMVARTT